MGAHCSIHNDTSDETVMIYVGVNTKVLQPILWSITGIATAVSGGVAIGSLPAAVSVTVATDVTLMVSVGTLTSFAGGLVSASNFVLDRMQTQLVNDLTKGGYHKCLPGQSYTTDKLPPALNLRAWVVRIQKTPEAIIIRRCSNSVWSGTKPGSQAVYRVMDKNVFPHWTKHETIPIGYQTIPKMVESEPVNIENAAEPATILMQDDEQETFTLVENGVVEVRCKVVETKDGEGDDDDAWIQVDAISTRVP